MFFFCKADLLSLPHMTPSSFPHLQHACHGTGSASKEKSAQPLQAQPRMKSRIGLCRLTLEELSP